MKQLRWGFALTTLLFGIAVTLFFALAYPHHLHFQEQYQLFLFEKSYLCEVLSLPGGLADLAGRFLTQFFLFAWVGAVLIALLLMGLQLVTYRLLRTSHAQPLTYALSFIPTTLCCCFLCDENSLLSAPIALLIIMGMTLLVQSIVSDRIRQILGFISIPLTYLLAGAFVLPYTFLLIIRELQRKRSLQVIVLACGMLILSLATPAAWHHFVHFNHQILYAGPHYYRDPNIFPYWAWAASSILPVLLLLPEKLRGWAPRHAFIALLCCWTVLMLAGGTMIHSLYSQSQEDTMAYDFMSRNALWNRILQKAEQRAPRNQVSAVSLNLALAAKGSLCERMFEYPQNGIAGLLPNFSNDCVSPLATAEAFYRLGLINTAQCFVFEAQEAIPDFQKSARCYKRLAETNLINGAYEVARKYLVALQHTLFYRSWAEQTLALIADDAAVEAHPEYGVLRSMRSQENYFFGGNELHLILARQLQSNPHNRMAFEYLEAACMLAKDVEKVTNYYSFSAPFDYQAVPSAIQQAMLLHWSQNHQPSDPIPAFIQPGVMQSFNQFYSLLETSNGNPGAVQRSFGKTYWSYYYFHR